MMNSEFSVWRRHTSAQHSEQINHRTALPFFHGEQPSGFSLSIKNYE